VSTEPGTDRHRTTTGSGLELGVHRRQVDGWTVVGLDGQLDVATAPQLRQALQEAHHGGATRLVVDLAGVVFLDSMGLGVLVGASRRSRAAGGELVLAAAGERIRHVLELSRVAEIVRVVGSVEDVVTSG